MQMCSGLDVSIVSKNVLKGSALLRVFPRNGFAYLSRLGHTVDGKKFIGCVSKVSLVSRLLRQDFWGPSVHREVMQCFNWFSKGSAKSLVTK